MNLLSSGTIERRADDDENLALAVVHGTAPAEQLDSASRSIPLSLRHFWDAIFIVDSSQIVAQSSHNQLNDSHGS